MDQHSNAQATTQPTPEGDSRDMASATSSSTAIVSNSNTRYFDFFGLPRELRDKIYEEPALFEYEQLPATNQYDWITKAKKLRTSLLRVSRQFRDEYTERCASKQVLYMRDHCSFVGSEAVLSSPDRARSWVIEFYVVANGRIIEDLEMLKDFLALWATPDLTLRSIDIRLLFVGTLREEIESRRVRHAISELQALRRVFSLDIHLAEKLWDFRKSDTPKTMIAHWERSDDMHIEFLTPASEVYGKASEWGHQSDIVPDCCDPSREPEHYVDSEDDGENDSDGGRDDESDSGSHSRHKDGGDNNWRNEYENDGAEKNGGGNDSDAEDSKSVDVSGDKGPYTMMENEDSPNGDENDSNAEPQQNAHEDAEEVSNDRGEDRLSEDRSNGYSKVGDDGNEDADTDKEADQAFSYFNFFGLPPEIRDMIYGQPSLLEETRIFYKHSSGRCSEGMFVTKPSLSMLLVSCQFNSEYKKRAQVSSGVFPTFEDIGRYYTGRTLVQLLPPLEVPRKAAQEARFMHVYVGEWPPRFCLLGFPSSSPRAFETGSSSGAL